jgi:hypothetical protein
MIIFRGKRMIHQNKIFFFTLLIITHRILSTDISIDHPAQQPTVAVDKNGNISIDIHFATRNHQNNNAVINNNVLNAAQTIRAEKNNFSHEEFNQRLTKLETEVEKTDINSMIKGGMIAYYLLRMFPSYIWVCF